MLRIAYVILCSCPIVFAGLVATVTAANAGYRDDGYRDNGYRDNGNRDDGYYVDVAHPPHRASRVWYSSRCCYMKIVRHVGDRRQVRYVKVDPSRMKKAWLEQKRERVRERNGYDRPRKRVGRYGRSWRDEEYKVIVVRRDGDGDGERCRHRRVRVLKPGGGWTWAVKARCE